MSRALNAVWTEVREGRLEDVSHEILSYIYAYGCDDDEITDMVNHYFSRVYSEED